MQTTHRQWLLILGTIAPLLLFSAAPVQPAAAQSSGAATPGATQPDTDDDDGQPPRGQRVDPFLKYAQNVEVRVSQLEIGDFPVVRAFVSVTDQTGVLLRDLATEDFFVEENDLAAAEVRFANREELDVPLAIQLVLDISGSMGVEVDEAGTMALDLAKQAVRDFVAQLQPRDRVGLITFSDAAIREVRMSTDHAELLRRLERLVPWGQTTLWDAIFLAMEELIADPTPARRALIVLSDGQDNKSLENPQSILQYYQDEAVEQNIGFSVYTLGLGPEIDRAALDKIATGTGGLYFDSPNAADLADVYQDILRQIQSEYFLEWDSPGETEPGQIIDVRIGVTPVKSFTPGMYTYRSPGLTQALARALWPGLIAIGAVIAILVIATIFRLSRRSWVTVMITPLEGKDYVIGNRDVDIGTAESCEVRIPGDPAMLPIHATLRESSDGYALEAIDPHSPIIMGGQLLAKKLLRSGDRFKLGTTSLVFSERVIRPGEGTEVLAEHVVDLKPAAPLTEDAQVAGQQGGAAAAAAVARQAPRALVADSGPHAGTRFELSDGENVIGRLEGQILLAGDSQVSRRHCAITLSAGQASLIDPGSTNGTLLNGARCQAGLEQAVWAGDVLAIGLGQYRLE